MKTEPTLTEAQLQRTILDACRQHRLLAFHVLDSRKSVGVGFPDLCIAGPGGTIFRELKNSNHQPTPEQMTWLGTLEEGGSDAGLWRPSHLQSGEVMETLARITRKRVTR
jgi:hypothetical protein